MQKLITCVSNMRSLSKQYGIDLSIEIFAIEEKILKTLEPASDKNNVNNSNLKNKKIKKKIKIINRVNDVDFKAGSKLFKGISLCQKCNKKHLNCRIYTLFKGSEKSICKFCIKKQKEIFHWKNNTTDIRHDALDHSIPGSYESGKKGR